MHSICYSVFVLKKNIYKNTFCYSTKIPVDLPDLAVSCHLMQGWMFETMQKVAVSSIPGCGEADGTLQDGATGPPPHYRDITVVVA